MTHIGVDIGGTFTDLVMSDGRHLSIHKLLSTPDNPARAMLAGLDNLSPSGLAGLRQVSHGSTVATNAILERKGAKTALITTRGFRDLLFIGRQNRPVLYDLYPQLPAPLIPRERCFEVSERLDHTGAVLTALDVSALDAVLDQISAAGIEAVAVCLLYSYVNSAHEQAVKARILQRGLLHDEQIALSSDVLPQFREYERASTTALDAYVRPVMSRYLSKLEAELPQDCGLRIMKSDGGVMSAARARAQAVQTALSGPAAGVIGAFHIAHLAGFDHIITLDIGGTSTDVALCPGAPIDRPESEIDGLPLRIRLLDIETIGAGGGSLARLDAGGALRVGPESAGAMPGPVCYGRGGTQATVSDANAVLGRLDAAHFLGGQMRLDVDAAQAALTRLGEPLGLPPEAAALGVIEIANVHIDRALRRVSVARGHDPRLFTLLAFGGAGPLHACDVADRIGIRRVLIPRYPGVLCALGLLVADVVLDYSRSVLGVLDSATPARLADLTAQMSAQAQADLAREGIPDSAMILRPLLDMRYRGQAYELSVALDQTPVGAGQVPPVTPPAEEGEASLRPYAGGEGEALAAAFHAAHERAYGHALHGRAIEVVNVRLQAIGTSDKPTFTPAPLLEARPAQPFQTRADGVALYQRADLLAGEFINGVALVFQQDSTVYLPGGWSARVDAWHNLVAEKMEE